MNYKNLLYSPIKVIVPLIFLTISSYLMYKGAGFAISKTHIVAMMLLVIFANSSKKAFYFIIIPIVLVYMIYAPIGFTFGKASYQYIASLFTTDYSETSEFMGQIPLENWFYTLAILISMLLFRITTQKFNINYTRNKTFLIIAIIALTFKQGPFDYFKNLKNSSMEVKHELTRLNTMKQESHWGKSTLTNKSNYDTYVLVIGESMRRDYLHTYGYPVNNTPFMDSAKGVVINGLEAGGTNTIASLRLMLTKANTKTWQPNYALNFIELAKSAGFKTYWLSNQGYLGTYDTPVTSIATQSDYTYFTKYGAYDSANTSDYLLLSKLKSILQTKPEKQKRLIVLHIYGSHPSACDRIDDFNKKVITVSSNKYKYLACYVNSIAKTDDFLSKTYSLLENNYKKDDDTFSLVFFADHGLSHRMIDNQILFNNNRVSKYHYNVPLMKFSSDDTQHIKYNAFKSGLNFTDGLAYWMGINNPNITPNMDLFSSKSMTNDYGLHNKLKNTVDDPAIDIRGK
ncbi:MAG: phosphoethanolamine transferase [Photobacterium aquimaris]|nr:phosphoethanolamine transferase [Photobacterium aquimaris]